MKKRTVIISILLIAIHLAAKNPIDRFTQNAIVQNANISLLVSDLNTNKTLHQYHSSNSMIPASTLKLVTTATALELLGLDFRFQTKLEMDGKVSGDSILNGNIYIRGGGDPTLGSEKMGDTTFLTKWVEAVKKFGIRKINGRIIADASLFDDEGVNPHWTWEDIGNYYASGAYGLSYMDNTFKLLLHSGQKGTRPTIIKTTPDIQALIFDNQLKSTGISSDSAYFYGAPHSNLRNLRGEIPANRTEFITKGDIPNPGLLLAQHLHNKLLLNGIETTQTASDQVTEQTDRTVIYTQLSPPLSDIVTEINIHSNNHYAEHVFRYLGLQNGSIATSTLAVQVIKAFWKSKGLNTEQLFMYDGSGLSPSDAVSAQFFVDLLRYMKNNSTNKTVFFNSLPISGKSGTLKSFLENSPLEGKVHAKSGTISRVKSYAGYLEKEGRSYAFAIIVNNANGSSKAVTREIEKFLLSVK